VGQNRELGKTHTNIPNEHLLQQKLNLERAHTSFTINSGRMAALHLKTKQSKTFRERKQEKVFGIQGQTERTRKAGSL
jgi:hypothetical protein